MTPKRKKLWIGLGLYAVLWIVTGVVGLPQIDRAFDREFAAGSPDAFATDERPARNVPASRVPYVRVTDPSEHLLPDIPFRSRSTGLPIAPFLVIDEACVAEAPLAAFSGRRMVFWFFGYTRWVPLKVWWVS
ncbi:MAG: hypothetical protein RLZZ436_324 [Planctomycetota bacterium]|jgi:hypothetical protein